MKRKLILITTMAALVWLWCGASAHAEDFEILWSVKTHISYSVSFSHDNRWILSWGDSDVLRIFNASNGELMNSSIPSTVQNPFFSKDDSHIYGKSYKDIAYYNTTTWENESHFEQCDKAIGALTVTDDEKYFIATTEDGIKIWDITTGKIIKEKIIPRDPQAISTSYNQITTSCDKAKLYVKSIENYTINVAKPYDITYTILKVYDFNTLDSIGCLATEAYVTTGGNGIRGFELSHDCSMIAIGYANGDVGVRIFRLDSMKLIRELKINGYACTGFKFTKDDKHIFTIGNGGGYYNMDYWNIETGVIEKQKSNFGFNTIDLSSDEQLIVVGSGKHINLFKSGITSADEQKEKNEIIYPNPTTGEVIITITEPIIKEIKLFGINGDLLERINPVEALMNPNTLKLNLSGYASGTYLIDITGQNWHKTYKVIINR